MNIYKNNTILLTGLVLALVCCSSCRNSRNVGDQSVQADCIRDDSLLTLIQHRTFEYFWSGAEPVSGMARERYHVDGVYPQNDMNVITTGGSGFGLMALITAIERDFITREEGYNRIRHIVDWLAKADRFHGAWPHWLYGETGRVKPFSPKDNGADIVETAYLVQGLLTARQYFAGGTPGEKLLAADIDTLWREVNWNFFTRGGEKVIYWHWSPDFEWEMNMPVEGYNECLIVYILAASSPTFPVDPAAFHTGWAHDGKIVSSAKKYGIPLIARHNYSEEYGGPLFWAHYSYLGLDPRGLKDKYADYWQLNVNHTLINHQWCARNPGNYKGYSQSRWGLSASYSPRGYAAHAPGKERDLGVISPTAAVSSVPYTPAQSMDAIRDFYFNLGDKLLGPYGFYDAFSEESDWFPQRYLAIDQGPQVVMIENFRTGLLWSLFMSCPEVRTGLRRLEFTSPWLNE